MKKIAIIYSFNTNKTAKIAEKIKEAFGEYNPDMINAEEINSKTFLSYDNLILGIPTWFDGELPNYWDEFIPELEDLDLKGKTIALYGLGDQKRYGENFLDGVGIMADLLEQLGAKLVGFTSAKDYQFESSKALRNDLFTGLAIDYENQGSKNSARVNAWVEQLRKELA
jgi:flavodoxin I